MHTAPRGPRRAPGGNVLTGWSNRHAGFRHGGLKSRRARRRGGPRQPRQTDQDPEVFFVAPLMLSGVRSSRPLVIAAARSADSSVIDSSISTSSSMAAR